MLFFKKDLSLFLFIISFSSLHVTAEENENTKDYRYYDVEIILFTQNNNVGLNSEYWTVIDDYQNEEGLVDDNIQDNLDPSKILLTGKLADYYVKSKTFIPRSNLVSFLPKENYRLTKEANHLKYSKHYKLLSHIAWRQAGLSKNKALPIKFNFGSSDMDGEIKIVLSRYLHAKVNFNLVKEICRTIKEVTIEDAEKVTIEVQLSEQRKGEQQRVINPNESIPRETIPLKKVCQLENIQFKQSRKMRSKEFHYLDHPVFGLLIQINRAKR